MSGESAIAPVIIKRKKVVKGDGHHGGSWKVAYADFVTAMMAFFMMMWLLSATTEMQRSGIADYFSPTIAIARSSGGGDGMLSGDSVAATQSLAHNGRGAVADNPARDDESREADAAEDAALQNLADALTGRGGESLVEDPIRQHVTTRVTDEGLVVEIAATGAARLFDDNAVPTEVLRSVMADIAEAAELVTNPVAIAAHTASFPIVQDGNPEWTVSQARAEAAHALAMAQGLAEARVHRVTAHADREPSQPNPMSVRNNRIEVVFLRR